MDGKHVVFGSVIQGKSLVREIENLPTSGSDKPQIPVTIADCGELPADYEVSEIQKADNYGDAYAEFPEDAKADDAEFKAEEVVKIVTEIKGFGAQAFKQQKFDEAIKKYRKGLRYLNEDPDLDAASPEDRAALKQLRITLNSNIALLCGKIGASEGKGAKDHYSDAVKHATFALEVEGIKDADKAKCLFRRALGHKGLKDIDAAIVDLEEAQTLAQEDKLIPIELKKLQDAQKAQKSKLRKVYSKAFE